MRENKLKLEQIKIW